MRMQSTLLLAAVLVLSVVNGQLIASNLVDELQKSVEFTTLYAAVNASGLAPTLKSNATKITVFAPGRSAFEALPSETLNCLLSSQGQTVLRALLKYHVVAGNIILPLNSSAAKDYPTLLGPKLSLQSFTNDTTVVNNGTVVSIPNLLRGSYYVGHLVSKVLLPPGATKLILNACPSSSPTPAPAPSPGIAPGNVSTPGTTTQTPPLAGGGPSLPSPPSGTIRPAVPMVLVTLASAMALFLLKPSA